MSWVLLSWARRSGTASILDCAHINACRLDSMHARPHAKEEWRVELDLSAAHLNLHKRAGFCWWSTCRTVLCLVAVSVGSIEWQLPRLPNSVE